MSGLEPARVRALLCDADGCLFPSEEPAFVASCTVTNRLLADLGIERRFTPEELRAVAVGKNFRATALDLAAAHGATIDADELERRVDEERREVIAHLAEVLEPDSGVLEPLRRLAARFELAVVSSSALARLDACFEATRMAGLFPPEARYSAEDSLPVPTSKPDPAIYALAGERLGVVGPEAVAIEDSVTGARSAVAAGFPAVGNVVFVPSAERAERIAGLRAAGVAAIVASWGELEELLGAVAEPAAG
jgi:beta-phosphoglucomutase-like phosphatase (HAD superfamily)